MRNPSVPTHPTVAAQMAETLGRGRRRVIDLGAGDGRLLSSYLQLSPTTDGVCVDRRRPALTAPMPEGSSVEWLIQDALRLGDSPTFDGVISNPPYVRAGDLKPAQKQALRREFESARGQFDVWFVFVEKALRMLEADGRAVFLVPEGIQTRPAAGELRKLLDEAGDWRTVPVAAQPFAGDVSVPAELLIVDRTVVPPQRLDASAQGAATFTVSVGAATGALDVFVRDEDDPSIAQVEGMFIRPVLGGRDLKNGCSRGKVIVWPYRLEGKLVVRAELEAYQGLSAFLTPHLPRLQQRARPRTSHFIQCPPAAILGERVAVSEVFRELNPARVPNGTVVLNSAFVITTGSQKRSRELIAAMTTKAGMEAVQRTSRALSSGYRRLTASGLTSALEALAGAKI